MADTDESTLMSGNSVGFGIQRELTHRSMSSLDSRTDNSSQASLIARVSSNGELGELSPTEKRWILIGTAAIAVTGLVGGIGIRAHTAQAEQSIVPPVAETVIELPQPFMPVQK